MRKIWRITAMILVVLMLFSSVGPENLMMLVAYADDEGAEAETAASLEYSDAADGEESQGASAFAEADGTAGDETKAAASLSQTDGAEAQKSDAAAAPAEEGETKAESSEPGLTETKAESAPLNSLSYTFASDDDSFMVLGFLRAHEINTLAVDDAEVDSDALELLDYIGDYMVAPLAHFESASLTVYTREGDSYVITLSYPEPAPYEQTLKAELPEQLPDTELTLSGIMPEGADVTVELVNPAVAEEDVLMALDISIGDYQPEQPILVSLSDPAIAAALAEGKELNIVHTDDFGNQELAEIVSAEGDTLKFKAPHFSQFDLVSSQAENIASWDGDGISLTLSGYGITVTETTVAVDEGIELLQAYEVSSSVVNRLGVGIDNRLTLGELESVDVYSVKDGKLGSQLTNLNNVGGSFALVLDSGLRRDEKSAGSVSVSGMLPKNATVTAEDVAAEYEGFTPLRDSKVDVLAAYDITIMNGEQEYEPDSQLQVSVALETEQPVRVWHIVDGQALKVEHVTVADGKVSFPADSFSHYLLTTLLTTTITASDGNTYKITVTYDEAAGIDEEAELRVSELSGEEFDDYLSRTATALGTEATNIYYANIFDIKIVGKTSGIEYEPANAVNVTIEMLDAFTDSKLSVVHFSDGKTDVYNAAREGNSLSFTTNSFSVYSIVDPHSQPRVRYNFLNDDGNPYYFDTASDGTTPINYQIVHNGGTLKHPGTPTSVSHPSYEFVGWYVASGSAGSYTATNTEIQFHTTGTNKETDPIAVTANGTVNLIAVYSNQHTVTYWDENAVLSGGVITGGSIVRADKVADGYTLYLSENKDDGHYTLYTPEDRNDTFLGWATAPKQSTAGETVTVSGNIDLFPVVADAHWVTYNTGESGNGASYIGARQYPEGTVLSSGSMPTPTRPGYTFDGWCTGDDGTGKVSSITINSDITLYARWEAADADYTVVFWVQSPYDDVNALDKDKNYDYYGAIVRSATTGSTANTTSADKGLASSGEGGLEALGSYFKYNANLSDTSATVAQDGSTVLNVYYDRKTITFNFKASSTPSSVSTPKSGELYWWKDGSQYFPLTEKDGAWYKEGSDTPYSGPKYVFSTGSTTIYSLTGLYEAPMTGYPFAREISWNRSGTIYTIAWKYYKVEDFTGDTWNLNLGTNNPAVTIHYMGEKIVYPDPANPTAVEGTYYENYTDNKYVYYGKWYDQRSAVAGTLPYNKMNAKDLQYEEIGIDEMSNSGGSFYPDVEVFRGYEIVGYTKNKAKEDGGTWVDKYDTSAISTRGVTDIYVYIARYRYSVELYSDNSVIFHATLPYGLNLYPVKDWTPMMVGVNKEGCDFDYWCWDRALTEEVMWDVEMATNPARLTVPANNVSVFAKWKPLNFVVELDLNGGETVWGAHQDTTFWIDYGKTISEYGNIERAYVSKDSVGAQAEGKDLYRYHHYIYVNSENDGYTLDTDGTTRIPGDFSAATQTAFYGALHSGVVANADSTYYAPKKAEYYPVTDVNKDQVQSFWDVHTTNEDGYSVSASSLDTTYYDNGLYVKISDLGPNAPKYRLVGWYQVDKSTGEQAAYPYNFTLPVQENIALRAVWVRTGTYKIKYQYNTDSAETYFYDSNDADKQDLDKAKSYTDQSLAVAPAAPIGIKDGSRFVGWELGGKVYYPGDVFRLNADYDALDGNYDQIVVLKAVYSDITKTAITFDGNGGTYSGSVAPSVGNATFVKSAILENDTIELLGASDFTRANYILIGWSTDPSRTVEDFKANTYKNITDFALGQENVAVNSDNAPNVLYAVWERTYTVTYDANLGGGTLDDNTLTANEDGTYSKKSLTKGTNYSVTSAQFTRQGYVMTGWNTLKNPTEANPGVSYAANAAITVTGDVTLYAQWEASYGIVYHVNRGSGTLTNPEGLLNNGDGTFSTGMIYRKGNNVTLSDGAGLIRSGYAFVGWMTEANGATVLSPNSYTFTNESPLTLHLYAKWAPLLYVTYNANGGSGSLTDGGSYKLGSAEAVTLTPVTNMVTNIPGGSTLTLSDGSGFTRTGYSLAGWNSDQTEATNGEVEFTAGASYGVLNANLTLYAVWAPKLEITYNLNGGSGSLRGLISNGDGTFGTGKQFDENQSGIVLNDGKGISKTDNTLVGWNTESDGSGTHYPLGGSFNIGTQNVTLYAEWRSPAFSITYDPNGGSGELTDAGGGSWTYPSNSSEPLDTHSLSPHANKVSGIPDGSGLTLSNGDGFVWYGHTQLGWNTNQTEATSGTVQYVLSANLDDVHWTGNTTLYAVWDSQVTVTFKNNGGTWTDSNTSYYVPENTDHVVTLTPGQTVTKPSNPTYTGYVFVGWTTVDITQKTSPADWSTNQYSDGTDYTNDMAYIKDHLWNFSSPVSYEATDNGNLNLYAVWANTITVTFDVSYKDGKNHTWRDSSGVFTPSSNGYQYTIEVPMGDTVTKPMDPEPNSEFKKNSNAYLFLSWLKDDSSKTAEQSFPSNVTEYDFDLPVGNEPFTLYTSWVIEGQIQTIPVKISKDLNVTTHQNEDFVFEYQICSYYYQINSSNALDASVVTVPGKGADSAPWQRFTIKPSDEPYIINLRFWAGSGNGDLISSGDGKFYFETLKVREVQPDGFTLSSVNTSEYTGSIFEDTTNNELLVDVFTNNGSIGIYEGGKGGLFGIGRYYWRWKYGAGSNQNNTIRGDNTWEHDGRNKPLSYTYGATFTNSIKTTDVTIKKTVDDPISGTPGSFDFNIILTDADGNPISGWNTGTAGSTNAQGKLPSDFSLSHNGTQALTLPVGAKLTVTEEGATTYDTTVNAPNLSGTQTGKTYVFTVPETESGTTYQLEFVNSKGTAPVRINKAVVNGTSVDNQSKTYSFTATVKNGGSTLTGYDANGFRDGVKTFTITGEGYADIRVPVGATVEIEENLGSDSEKYTVSASGGGNWSSNRYSSDTIDSSGDVVTFTNTRKLVNVTVTKTLVDVLATGSESFNFTATLTDGGVAVEGYTICGAESTGMSGVSGQAAGVYAFSLTAGQTVSLTVPYGAELVLEEEETTALFLNGMFSASPYNTAVSGTGGGTVGTRSYTIGSATAADAVVFTNTRKTVPVTVYKTTVDPLNQNRDFTFEGTVTTLAGVPLANWNFNSGAVVSPDSSNPNITNDEGYITFQLHHEQSKTLLLPAGAILVGRETDAGLYTTEISYQGVNVPLDVLANIPSVGDDIPVSALFIPGTQNIAPQSVPGDNPKSYTSDIPPWECKVFFTNTKPFVPITVTKTVSDPLKTAEVSESFTFTLTVEDRSGNAVSLPLSWDYTDSSSVIHTTTLNNTSGEFTITVPAGQTSASTVLWLPIGANIAIEEDADAFATTVKQGESGTATYTKVARLDNVQSAETLTFSNTRRTVPVRIIKVDGRGNPIPGAVFTSTDKSAIASGNISTNPVSTVFDGTLYRDSTITLSETTTPTNYTGITGTVYVRAKADGTVVSDVGTVIGPDVDGVYTVQIANTRNTHTLTVNKTLDDVLSTGTVDFSFRVTLKETNGGDFIRSYPVGGAGNVTDDSGVYTFTLSPTNGATASVALTIPEGADVTVEEALTSNPDNPNDPSKQVYYYDTTCTGGESYNEYSRTASFTNVTADKTLSFTNTRKTATIRGQVFLQDIAARCSKAHPHEGQEHDNEVTFEFTFELYNGDTPLSYGTFTLAPGRPGKAYLSNEFGNAIKMLDGETVTASMVVPVGAKLVFTENLTNEQKNYYDTTLTWGESEVGRYNAGGAADRTWTLDSVPNTGGVLRYENRQTSYTVKVKNVIGVSGYSSSLNYTATLYDASNNPLTAYSVHGFENGVRSFDLYNGENVELTVPADAKLVIVENTTEFGVSATATTPYTDGDTTDTSFTLAKVTQDGTVTFTNTRETYNAGISKVVNGSYSDLYGDTSFHFSYQVDTVTFNNGVRTTVQGDEQTTAFSAADTAVDPYTIPLYYWINGGNLYYQTLFISENADERFTVSASVADGTKGEVSGNDVTINPFAQVTDIASVENPGLQSATFTNTRKTAQLTVTKQVTGGGDTTKDFSFTLSGLVQGYTYSYTEAGTAKTAVPAENSVTLNAGEENEETVTDYRLSFTLKDGESMIITLPTGEYTVSETAEEGYTTTVGGNTISSTTLTLNSDTTLTFINDYPLPTPTGLDFSSEIPFTYVMIIGLALGFLAFLSKRSREKDGGEPPRPCGRGLWPRQGKEVEADGSG